MISFNPKVYPNSGLGISEVCSLLVKDVDLGSRKLFIRNSKEHKDRVVYISDTVAMALQQHLAIRPAQTTSYVFNSTCKAITTRSVQRRTFSQSIVIHRGDQHCFAGFGPIAFAGGSFHG